jgi:16S rRNA (cytidine1402-2'-O)-methyltransferase
VFGAARRAAVCRELTKLHEEIARGTLAELAQRFADGARGEIVVVVDGAAAASATVDLASAVATVLELAAGGIRMKEAAADVAAATGHTARDLYEAAIRAK